MKRRKRRATDPSDPRQTALRLVELALDEGTTLEERRSAALKAVRYIDQHDLLSRPFEGNKTVQAAVDVLDTLTDPSVRDGLKTIGAAIGEQLSRARQRR